MEFKDNKPIFVQIADRICDEILSDIYKVNERIPSVREFGTLLEVNPNTVMRTFELLTNAGIIYNKRGMGYFVSDESKDIIHKMRKEVFVNETLKDFFREMHILGISIDEVVQMYKEFGNQI